MDVEQDELMMLVPPLFSIKDMPEETVYIILTFPIQKNCMNNNSSVGFIFLCEVLCICIGRNLHLVCCNDSELQKCRER